MSFCRFDIHGFPPLEGGHCRFPGQAQSDIVDCHHGRPQSEVFEGACDSMGSLADVAWGTFLCRAHFGDDAWPADGRTRTGKWNCAPSSAGLHLLETLLCSTRTGTGFLAAFRVVNGLSDARQHRAGSLVSPPRGALGW